MIRRLIILLLIVGCATMKDVFVQDKSTAFFILGMTEEEFIRKNPSITKKNDWQRWEKVINSPESTTYIAYESKATFVAHKVDEKGKTTHGLAIPNPVQEYIFAFKNDTLFAVYHGELNDDLKREIDYRNYPDSKPE